MDTIKQSAFMLFIFKLASFLFSVASIDGQKVTITSPTSGDIFYYNDPTNTYNAYMETQGLTSTSATLIQTCNGTSSTTFNLNANMFEGLMLPDPQTGSLICTLVAKVDDVLSSPVTFKITHPPAPTNVTATITSPQMDDTFGA